MFAAVTSALPQLNLEEPPLPDTSSLPSKSTSPVKNNRTLASPIKLQQRLKRKSFKRDTSYEDELRRQELLEKRRQKQMELLEKMKSRQNNVKGEVEYIDGVPSFEDCELYYLKAKKTKQTNKKIVSLKDQRFV